MVFSCLNYIFQSQNQAPFHAVVKFQMLHQLGLRELRDSAIAGLQSAFEVTMGFPNVLRSTLAQEGNLLNGAWAMRIRTRVCFVPLFYVAQPLIPPNKPSILFGAGHIRTS